MQLAVPTALPNSLSKSSQDVLSELLITQLVEEDMYGRPEDFETFQLNQAILESTLLYQRVHKTLPTISKLRKQGLQNRIAFDAVYARDLQDEEKQILLDEEYAQQLQIAEDTRIFDDTPETESIFDKSPIQWAMATEDVWKGKGRAGDENSTDTDFYPTCGICMEPFHGAHSPIAASGSGNSPGHLPVGLRLPCPKSHPYCNSCLASYIKSKLDPEGDGKTSSSRVVFPIKCPECSITEWPEGVTDDVAEQVLEDTVMWHHQKLLDSIPKNYCPNPRCSALIQLGNDTRAAKEKCPACRVSLCVPCWSVWHEKMTCEEYQALPLDERSPEDRQALKLMRARNWRRCPSCSAIVEHHLGCNHMTCLCKAQFCYRCGSIWNPTLGRCGRETPCNMWDESTFLEDEVNQPEPVTDRRRSSRLFRAITRILQLNR